MTTMIYAGDGKRGHPRNRRTTSGQLEILCQKCGEWKPATDDHFYRYAGALRSPCRACITAANRTRCLCKHEGCTVVVSTNSKTGYCQSHYYLHEPKAQPKFHCVNCGKTIAQEGVTGLCLACYVSTGAMSRVNAENGLKAKEELPRPTDIYSNLSELHDSPGVAPAGNDWIRYRNGERH